MLVINNTLGTTIVLPESVCKVRSKIGGADDLGISYGIDVISSTEHGSATTPTLNPTLLAALHLRVAAVENADVRSQLQQDLNAYVEDLKADMADNTAALAWGLEPRQSGHTAERLVRPKQTQQNPYSRNRVPATSVRMAVVEKPFSPTSMEELERGNALAGNIDPAARKLMRGTQYALRSGQARYAQLAAQVTKTPELYFGNRAYALRAVSDAHDTLTADSCYVIVAGHPLVGFLTVWRFPCHTITDVETLQAVKPPRGVVVVDNAITFSRHGRGNAGMAGGDYDGDHDFVTFDERLHAIVKKTEVDVRSLPLAEAAHEIDMQVPVYSSEWSTHIAAEREIAFKSYALNLNTFSQRGQACRKAEQATHKAITLPGAREKGYVIAAHKTALAAHKMLDAPKKHRQTDVMQALQAQMAPLALKRRYEGTDTKAHNSKQPRRSFPPLTSTEGLSDMMRVKLPTSRRRAYELHAHLLDNVPYARGQVWLPSPTLRLGREAGAKIMSTILQRSFHIGKPRPVTQLSEVAALVHNALAVRLGSNPKSWCDRKVEEVEEALWSRRHKPVKSWRTVNDSKWP